MASKDEIANQNHYNSDTDAIESNRALPIIQSNNTHSPAPSQDEPMDETPPPSNATMGPPARSSPDTEPNGRDHELSGNTLGPSAAAAAQAGTQTPKVVQTAFIHKLYNMLEDQSIQHLISWSNSAESFVMSPSGEFSKVLSQYFKHTNISSFVRQLNMYGFHKVSDVFHTGSPDSTLWEFKHGNGNFKRGDLVGLREIKRRASRHALVHRDSYPTIKPPPYSQPGTPQEPMPQPMQEPVETRLAHIEHSLYEAHGRLSERDSQIHQLHSRNQALTEALVRSMQLNQDMSKTLVTMVNNPEAPTSRTFVDIQVEFERIQHNLMRPIEDLQEPPFPGGRPYFSNLSLDNAPVSPRQIAQDDVRRQSMMGQSLRQPFRPAVPPHLSITPRRYGSIGTGSVAPSPSSLRYQTQVPPPQPPPAHPLATVQSPPTNLPRRHTSADIRADLPSSSGWRPTPSPFAPGQQPSQWPPSPDRRSSVVNEDQRIRDSFSSYSLASASAGHQSQTTNGSRPTTPPFSNGHANVSVESLGNWSWGKGAGMNEGRFGGQGFAPGGLLKDGSGPPTRRGSMAHILNPAVQEEDGEDDDEGPGGRGGEDDRKRKRVQ